jgi:hypothetical protein
MAVKTLYNAAHWVSGGRAAKIIGCSFSHVGRLADEGRITTYQVPGLWVRYSKADCERLARESLTRAADRRAATA